MTPQNLNLMANGFYIASGICLAVGIYFFFNLHIIEVFNDLTGRSVKKQLQLIRTQPQLQTLKPSLPASASPSKSRKTKFSSVEQRDDREIKLGTEMSQATGAGPTDRLQSDSEPTTLLAEEAATTILNSDSMATTVLGSPHFETENQEDKIRIIKQEIVIHTDLDPELRLMETDS
jgi:hypothetical protein